MMNPELQKSAQWILHILHLQVRRKRTQFSSSKCGLQLLALFSSLKTVRNVARARTPHTMCICYDADLAVLFVTSSNLNCLHSWSYTVFHQFSRLKHLSKVDVQSNGLLSRTSLSGFDKLFCLPNQHHIPTFGWKNGIRTPIVSTLYNHITLYSQNTCLRVTPPWTCRWPQHWVNHIKPPEDHIEPH